MAANAPATGKLWFGKDGTWFNSGDPGAGTGQTVTAAASTGFVPAASLRRALDSFKLIPWPYAVPTGFSKWGE